MSYPDETRVFAEECGDKWLLHVTTPDGRESRFTFTTAEEMIQFVTERILEDDDNEQT